MAEADKSMELAGVVERAMHEFSEAMGHREQLSIRIGRRTTQILRFGTFGLTVLSLIMFYLLHILTTDFAKITANMDVMSAHMTNLDQTITRASNDMTDLRQTLSKTLQGLPVDQLANNLLAASQSINKLASLPELRQSLASLDEAMGVVNQILKSPESRKSVASLHTTLDHIDSLVQDLNRQVKPISADLHAALVQARSTMTRADGTLTATQQLVSD